MRLSRIISVGLPLTVAMMIDACGRGSDARSSPKDVNSVAPPRSVAIVDTALLPGMVSAATVGVFTSAQAKRGQQDWTASCARCHSLTHHSGSQFEAGWNHRKVSELYERVSTTMPQDEPGSLAEDQYADIVAYVLKLNGMPAGRRPLPADPSALKKIRIDLVSH